MCWIGQEGALPHKQLAVECGETTVQKAMNLKYERLEVDIPPPSTSSRKKTVYFLERLAGNKGCFRELAENVLKMVSCEVTLQDVSSSFNWDRFAVLLGELYFVEHGHLKVFNMNTGELIETISVPLDSIGGVTMFEEDLFVWTVSDIYQISRREDAGTELIKVGATQCKEPFEMVRLLRREERRLEVVVTYNTIYDAALEGTWRFVFIDGAPLSSRAKIHDGRLAGVFDHLVYVHHMNSAPQSNGSELIALRVERFSSTASTVSRHPVVPSSWSVAVSGEGYVRLCYQSNSGKGFLEVVDIREWRTLCKDSTGPDLCRWVDCAPVPVLLDY